MNKIIRCSPHLNCGLSRAFELFTVNSSLDRWLAAVAEVGCYAGENYELFWDQENRDINSTKGCQITAYI